MRLCSYLLNSAGRLYHDLQKDVVCPKWLSAILIPNCMAEMFYFNWLPEGHWHENKEEEHIVIVLLTRRVVKNWSRLRCAAITRKQVGSETQELEQEQEQRWPWRLMTQWCTHLAPAEVRPSQWVVHVAPPPLRSATCTLLLRRHGYSNDYTQFLLFESTWYFHINMLCNN